MAEPHHRQKLPGNRIIRRRQNPTKIITVANLQKPRDAHSVRSSAQKFVLGFLTVVLVGALLLTTPAVSEDGMSTSFVDAVFTSMSAASVTGLVVFDTQEQWNFWGELVILALIQIGGLGFMVGASLILTSMRRGSSLRDTLLLQDGSPTLSLREATDLSWRVLRFVLTVEGTGAVLLSMRFMADQPPHLAIWYGVFHSVSAFCNAGFDLYGGYRSLTSYDRSLWVNLVVAGLIQAGSLSYLVFADIWKHRVWRAFALDTRLVMVGNAIAIAIGACVFVIVEWSSSLAAMPAAARPMAAVFQSVSARTAGFSTVNIGDLESPTMFLWVGLMGLGGAAGSTAGGVKIATLAIVVIAVMGTVSGQRDTHVFGRRISPLIVFRAMAIISLFLVVHFGVTLLLAASEHVLAGNDVLFIDLMFEAMSALATVGLSTGITPNLSDTSKVILCIGMLFGRLGPLTAVYALQRRSRPARYRYPEATIRLG